MNANRPAANAQPERMKMESTDLYAQNVAALKTLFPGVVTESRGPDGTLREAVDFDRLRELFDGVVVKSGAQERYEFNWVGKSEARAEAYRQTRKTLRPYPTESVNWDATQNLYIEGDNLEVLKLLQASYLGKVKMIYIDPPYNTGHDFVYHDNFHQAQEDYDRASGKTDENGIQQFTQNNDTNPQFHSDWCSMIYSRLLLARNLLTEDGVIFISIDDNEVENLRKISDEIFGAQNFVASLVWAAGRKNDSRFVSVSHEYILCYVRSFQFLSENNVTWKERKRGLTEIYAKHRELVGKYGVDYQQIEKELRSWYKELPESSPAKAHAHYKCVDERGIYFPGDASWPGGGGPRYEILHPKTGKPVKIPSGGWRFSSRDTMLEKINQNMIHFGADETFVPCVKRYLKDTEHEAPYSVIYKDGRAATKKLKSLMGEMVFQNPKDAEIIQGLLEFTMTSKNMEPDIVLDFFSGSATTAQVVMQINAKRLLESVVSNPPQLRYILVQLPDECDPRSEAAKSGYATICEIGKERIRRAGAQILAERKTALPLLDRQTDRQTNPTRYNPHNLAI